MIAVDTNVLLRRFLHDDPIQSAKADRLFDGKQGVLLTDIVLAEFVWVLEGKRYGATREDIVQAIGSLFEEPRVQFENRAAVWSALRDYAEAPAMHATKGRSQADFTDALIARKAAATAVALGEAFGGLFTFDHAAQGLPAVRAL